MWKINMEIAVPVDTNRCGRKAAQIGDLLDDKVLQWRFDLIDVTYQDIRKLLTEKKTVSLGS